MQIEKECEKRRSASRERESRGVRDEKERVEKECELRKRE